MQKHLSEAIALMTEHGLLSSYATPEEMYHNLGTIHFLETGGQLHATSWTGVKGSMQVTQATFAATYEAHRSMLEAAGVPENREDPRASAIVGSLYYNEQHKEFNGNAVAAAVAYNSGPQAGHDYINGNIVSIRAEGQGYIEKFERNHPRVAELLGGFGPDFGIASSQIFNQVQQFYDRAASGNLNISGLEGKDAFTAQLALKEIARQMQAEGISLPETIDLDAMEAEMGRVAADERARIEGLGEEEKEAYFDKNNIVTQNGQWYDLDKVNPAGEQTQALAAAVANMSPDQLQTLRERNRQELQQREEEERTRTRDTMAAINNAGLSEEAVLLMFLFIMAAYASGNEELADQMIAGLFGADRDGNTLPEYADGSRGYRHQQGPRPTGAAPQDVLAGRDLSAQGFTENKDQPYWVSLGPDGKPIAGNMAFERATPMSTTKMATLLTIADMIDKGELPKDFLEQHVGLVNAMMQRSSNSAPVELARLASGGEAVFVARMNRMAAERGLQGTQYTNPVGFNTGPHYSTAYDVALVGYYLNRDHPEIAETYAAIGGGHTGQRFAGVNGTTMGKTGTGRGNEGRSDLDTGQNLDANKAWVGMIGENGASYAVLEAVAGWEQRTFVRNASRTSLGAIAGAGLNVEQERGRTNAQRAAVALGALPQSIYALVAAADINGDRAISLSESQTLANDDQTMNKIRQAMQEEGVTQGTGGENNDLHQMLEMAAEKARADRKVAIPAAL